MLLPLLIALPILSLQTLPSFAADPPPDFKFNVMFYISDSCCGGSFGLNGVRPDECIYVGASRPGGYGTTILISGSPFGGGSTPGPGPPPDPLLYGYGIGWSGTQCTDKVFEIRTRGCYRAEDTSGSVRSFSFVLDPNMPSGRTSVGGGAYMAETGTTAVSIDSRQASPCRAADWFEYVDQDLGRRRRVAVNGSETLIETVAKLYDQGKFGELRELEQ